MSTLRSRARLLALKIDAFGGDLRRANSLRPSISKSKGPPRDRISRGEMRHYLREVPGYQGGRYHRSLPHGANRGLSSLGPKWNPSKRFHLGEDEQRSKADIRCKTDEAARSLRGRDGADRGLTSLRPKWNPAKRVCFGEDEQRSKADIWRKMDGAARSLRGRPTE